MPLFLRYNADLNLTNRYLFGLQTWEVCIMENAPRFICIYARIARCSNCPYEKRKRTGE